jgi:FAD synthetase
MNRNIRVLGSIFSLGLTGPAVTLDGLAKAMGLGDDGKELEPTLRALEGKGLVKATRHSLSLTADGRRKIKIVFIGGGFEIIHAGHLHTLNEARSLGDVLVAVVARDSTIRRRKGREPISPEKERVALLQSLRQVDAALLGVEGNIYEMLEKVKPDIVALGYDQYHAEGEISDEASRRGLNVKVVRLGTPNPSIKTTKLLQEF